MLHAGGALVTLAGFTRGQVKVARIDNIEPVNLGHTSDGKFAQRLLAVGRALCKLSSTLRNVAKPDVIIARNLEMLALANRASTLGDWNAPIVYECLDIHRMLLRQDIIGRCLRFAERLLARRARLLITSSPAFVDNYFTPFNVLDMPVMLLENKVFRPTASPDQMSQPIATTTPWKIGWFGALRCRRSLELLADFTRRSKGQVEVILRGRPAYSEFDNFDRFVAEEPYLHFYGPYKNPEELAAIYSEVHFSWTIDFFEAGQNSDWLLPNRLYEGCLYGAVPIGLAGTQTSRFLQERNIGFSLHEPTVDALVSLFGQLDEKSFLQAQSNVTAQPREGWECTEKDCRSFVDHLRQLAGSTDKRAIRKIAA
nr:glycosyl transferase family 1 [Phyllobacterium zundukense]